MPWLNCPGSGQRASLLCGLWLWTTPLVLKDSQIFRHQNTTNFEKHKEKEEKAKDRKSRNTCNATWMWEQESWMWTLWLTLSTKWRPIRLAVFWFRTVQTNTVNILQIFHRWTYLLMFLNYLSLPSIFFFSIQYLWFLGLNFSRMKRLRWYTYYISFQVGYM